MGETIDELARRAFAAYNQAAGGKTWDGKDIPPWEKVTEQVRNNWRAAARAVEIEVMVRDSEGLGE